MHIAKTISVIVLLGLGCDPAPDAPTVEDRAAVLDQAAENMLGDEPGPLAHELALTARSTPLVCPLGSTDLDLARLDASDVTGQLRRIDANTVALVLEVDDGRETVAGCISADTAELSLEHGLGIADVGAARDGVRVVIATPEHADMRELDWLTPVGPGSDDPAQGFVVTTFVVHPDAQLQTANEPTPTELQLFDLVEHARNGEEALVGLGPDLLMPRD